MQLFNYLSIIIRSMNITSAINKVVVFICLPNNSRTAKWWYSTFSQVDYKTLLHWIIAYTLFY